ncbi:MAG: hypothetical protein NTX50_25755 [Candidatus Sumerlaeota bacterium]|nr:hypothetical protein [Candidatus Sumerlaeota bacterium]
MTKVQEIETAISALPEQDYTQLRNWFLERDWEKWDREIEEDSEAGRLDFLVKEAREAKAKGNFRNL